MTFDLIVTLVLSVFLVLVTIDRQHDANRVLYVKAVWPRPDLGSGLDLYYFHETRFARFLKNTTRLFKNVIEALLRQFDQS